MWLDNVRTKLTQDIYLSEEERKAYLDRNAPGFTKRHPNGPIRRLDGKWQYGYQIEGYGYIRGWCKLHKPHRTQEQAEACGHRYENGFPPRLIDQIRFLFGRPIKQNT